MASLVAKTPTGLKPILMMSGQISSYHQKTHVSFMAKKYAVLRSGKLGFEDLWLIFDLWGFIETGKLNQLYND
jgi:hypothetical protein